MAVGLSLLWIAAGIVVWLVGWAGSSGRLPRNHWAGVRLPSVMASDEAWFAAHKVAGPWLQGGGALTAMIGLLLLVFAPAPATADAISLVLAVILLATVIGAAIVGAREAKRIERS
jgi:uncharacterized membrane protein